MANEDHLKILKQGVEIWNRWRGENPGLRPDLRGASLFRADLREADLRAATLDEADLGGAALIWAHLGEANLPRIKLGWANLSGADLRGANLASADLYRAYFSRADLSGAYLGWAELIGATLDKASLVETNLTWANLSLANLSGAKLDGTNFRRATVKETIFADLDLSAAKGLDAVEHQGPSPVGTDTLARSRGQIPEAFLRGCGLSDWEIEAAKLYRPDLSRDTMSDILYRIHDLRARQAIQVNSLFISYSRADGPFVDCLEGYLNRKGIRFWRDVHDATAGRLEKQIDRAMRLNPTVLLVLSAEAVRSDWVEHEARRARDLEKELGRDVLCPVALDASWKTCRWPERLREQIKEYNILDFSAWQDEAFFRRQFAKLIDGLDLFYKSPGVKPY